jgi:hypothetical protein
MTTPSPYFETPFWAPGQEIWRYSTPALTMVASPLYSGWLPTTGYSKVMPAYKFTGGTTVITFEGSWDGSTLDTDIAYGTITSGTAVNVLTPFFRVKVVQTIADNTVTKIYLKSTT